MSARSSQNLSQSKFLAEDLSEPPAWEESAAALSSADKKSGGSLRSIGDHDWITAVLCTLCDIVCWVALYGIVGYVRRDQFFVSPFEFVLVDCVVLAVILQALYIIGGYNRNTRSDLHDRAYPCRRSSSSNQFTADLFSGDIRHGDEAQPWCVVDQFYLFPPDIPYLPAIFSAAHCDFGGAASVPRDRKRRARDSLL